MADQNIKTELSRELNLFHLTMLGLGMMIGAGVFLGIGNSIYHSGPGGVILTFAFNGVLALCTALSYAELSSAIPKAGGAFNFAKLAFGSQMSFLAGWMEWFASSIAGSMYAVTFSIYTVRYFETIGMLSPEFEALLIKPTAVAVALLFLFINYRGASETGKIGALMTLGQTFFLVLLAVIGIVVALREPSRFLNFDPFLPKGWGRLLMTMGFTYVAFEGYEVIAQAGDEAINPHTNLPKAMILSVSIAALTYVGVSFATVVSVRAGYDGVEIPWEWIGAFKEKGFGEAVARLIPAGNILLTIAVIFASTSALNSTIFSATRASYALGRDGLLPPVFARISRTRKTPVGALCLTGIIVIFVGAFLPTMDVASSASIMFLFLFFVVNLSAIIIRWRLGDELKYGFVMPLFPLFPVIGIIMQAVLALWLVEMSLIAWIIAPLWILSGVLLFLLFGKKHMVEPEEDLGVIEEEPPEKPQGNTKHVLVAVANPNSVSSLTGLTLAVVPDRKAVIEFLHMVPVPSPVALSDANHIISNGRGAINKAYDLIKGTYPIARTVRYCRNISRGIITTAKERHSSMLIMGWHGKRTNRQFTLGSTLDPVICRTPGNIIISKGDVHPGEIESVLVPLFGGLNDALAMKVAEYILPEQGGKITALYSNRAKMRPGHVHNILNNIVTNPRISIREINTQHKKMEHIIVQESEHHETIVLGISEPRTCRLGFPSLSERIASRIDRPMLLVKTNSILGTLAKRLF